MKILYFCTSTFPFGGVTEESFIRPELKFLSDSFDKVIFVPEHTEQDSSMIDVSYKNITADDTFAKRHIKSKNRSLLSLLIRPLVIKAVLYDIARVNSIGKLFSLLSFYRDASDFANWLNHQPLCPNDEIVVYTFWFHWQTTGAVLSKNNITHIFSRAHGFDIFDDRVQYRSHYLRDLTLKGIDKVYACSHMGANYIKNNYIQRRNKVSVSILGTPKFYKELNPSTADVNEIVFFTCARMHPVKRLPMTLNLLNELANTIPQKKIRWILVGDGEDKKELQNIISRGLEPNLRVEMRGLKTNNEVHEIYRHEHIDWNLLLSESEGLSIALCESLSYGVPAIVTNVGGLPEIINNETGILLSYNPSVDQIVKKLSLFYKEPKKYEQLRKTSYLYWHDNFNSEVLRKKFVNEISK